MRTFNNFEEVVNFLNRWERRLEKDTLEKVTRQLLDYSQRYVYVEDGDIRDSGNTYSNVKAGEVAYYIPNGYVDKKGNKWKTGYTLALWNGENFKRSNNSQYQPKWIEYAWTTHQSELQKSAGELGISLLNRV
jgi:hypothetical protein